MILQPLITAYLSVRGKHKKKIVKKKHFQDFYQNTLNILLVEDHVPFSSGINIRRKGREEHQGRRLTVVPNKSGNDNK